MPLEQTRAILRFLALCLVVSSLGVLVDQLTDSTVWFMHVGGGGGTAGGSLLSASVPTAAFPVHPPFHFGWAVRLAFGLYFFFGGTRVLFFALPLDHRCPNCNYALTGITSPRCPECGHATKPNT